MPDATTLAVFSLAAFALIVVPGPAVLYVVARSVEQGRRAGLVSTLGIGTGALVHVTAAAVGLSSLLVSSATAFTVVKYAGAVYLIVLGVRTMLGRGGGDIAFDSQPRPLRHLYTQGVVVNILNPKTALFFLAFLPQFVDPDAGSAALQIVVLGGVFVAIALASDAMYALAAGTASAWARRNVRALRLQRRASGAVLVGLGVLAATTRRNA